MVVAVTLTSLPPVPACHGADGATAAAPPGDAILEDRGREAVLPGGAVLGCAVVDGRGWG